MKSNKQDQIIQAVYRLVQREGLVNISMSKIAKEANVATATIYIYYENKTALFSQLYRDVKIKLDGGLATVWPESDDVQTQLITCLKYFATATMTYPDEYQFMMAINNSSEIIDDETREFSNQMAKPLFKLFEAMMADKRFKKLTLDQVIAFTFAPIQALAMNRTTQFSTAELDQLVQMCLDALCV